MEKTTQEMLSAVIAAAHPQWDGQYTQRLAGELTASMEPQLIELLRSYHETGKMKNFSHCHDGETFSVLEIRALRGGGSYLDAVMLMDAYIKDPAAGRRRIMSRR